MSEHRPERHSEPGAQNEVLAFLGRPETHRLTETPLRIDTHAAIVFLAGSWAYKVKRAVRYPYLDFSTLDLRKQACDAEIRLNRPNAPEIYVDVVPVVRREGGLAIGGEGDVVEWAVRMRRFDPEATLDRVAESEGLSKEVIEGLVERVVAAHGRAPEADGAAAITHLAELVEDNLAALESAPDVFPAARVKVLGHG